MSRGVLTMPFGGLVTISWCGFRVFTGQRTKWNTRQRGFPVLLHTSLSPSQSRLPSVSLAVVTRTDGPSTGGCRAKPPPSHKWTISSALPPIYANFVRALQSVSTEGRAGADESSAASPGLQRRDAHDDRLASDLIDAPAARAVWEEASAAPPHSGAPVWVHGDIEGNCLLTGGRLSGLVDWGSACAGDPAVDVQVVWSPLFTLSLAPPFSWPSTWMMQHWLAVAEQRSIRHVPLCPTTFIRIP